MCETLIVSILRTNDFSYRNFFFVVYDVACTYTPPYVRKLYIRQTNEGNFLHAFTL